MENFMQNYKNLLMLAFLNLYWSASAMEFVIPPEQLFVPSRLASRSTLVFDGQKFKVTLDEKTHIIRSYYMKGLPTLLTLIRDYN
jgi:hypothetical protein